MYSPRSTRDMDRGKRAAAVVKATGGGAIQCMEAQIDATFGPASVHNRIKRECDLAIRKGADSDHVVAWYRRIALKVDDCRTIDQAISAVKLVMNERRQFMRRPLTGRENHDPENTYTASAPHLHVERCYGALVMLRLMRAKKFTDSQFRDIVDCIIGARLVVMAEAAE